MVRDMSNTTTTTMTAAEALRAYGATYNSRSCGYHLDVLHPVTGKWVTISGGTSWSDNDDMILGVFTGRVEKFYDEHGEHDSPHFTHLAEDGAIAVKRDTVLTVRNAR